MDIVDSILDKLQSKYVIWWVDAVHHTDRHMMCDVWCDVMWCVMCDLQDEGNSDNYDNDDWWSSHFLIISLERPLMVHASCWIWGIPRLTNILHALQQIKWLADIKYVFFLQIYVWWVESLKTGKLITKYGDNVNSEPNQHLSMWLDDETQIVLNMLGVKETNYTRVDFI